MKASKDLVLVGYGGHAVSVLSTLEQLNIRVKGYVDTQEKTEDPFSLDYLGTDEEYLKGVSLATVEHICAVGDNTSRERIQKVFEAKGASFRNVIHPTAFIESKVELGRGVFIGAFSYVNGLASIGDGCIINNHTNIEHGSRILGFCHIGPSSVLAGDVHIGARTFLGCGSRVIPGIMIHEDVTLGAGSTLIKNVEEPCTMVGSPAKKI